MAYEPTEWACGDVVTAEKLNKIERGVADIMSDYVPTEWQCGDTITAEKMNKIEQGIANADCGGGGSSDFSTAEVTVNDSVQSDIYVQAWINENDELLAGNDRGASYNFGTGLPFTLVLYKAQATIEIETDLTATVVATVNPNNTNIVDKGEGVFDVTITGDCTITIL